MPMLTPDARAIALRFIRWKGGIIRFLDQKNDPLEI